MVLARKKSVQVKKISSVQKATFKMGVSSKIESYLRSYQTSEDGFQPKPVTGFYVYVWF